MPCTALQYALLVEECAELPAGASSSKREKGKMAAPYAVSIPEFPEILALRALGFISRDRAELDRFLTRASLLPQEVNVMPIRREVLAAVLDFLVQDEKALTKFAHSIDVPLEAAYAARRRFDS